MLNQLERVHAALRAGEDELPFAVALLAPTPKDHRSVKAYTSQRRKSSPAAIRCSYIDPAALEYPFDPDGHLSALTTTCSRDPPTI